MYSAARKVSVNCQLNVYVWCLCARDVGHGDMVLRRHRHARGVHPAARRLDAPTLGRPGANVGRLVLYFYFKIYLCACCAGSYGDFAIMLHNLVEMNE